MLLSPKALWPKACLSGPAPLTCSGSRRLSQFSVPLRVLLTCTSAAECPPQVMVPVKCLPLLGLFNSSDGSSAPLFGAACPPTPSRRHGCNTHFRHRLSACFRFFPDFTAGFWESRLPCNHWVSSCPGCPDSSEHSCAQPLLLGCSSGAVGREQKEKLEDMYPTTS